MLTKNATTRPPSVAAVYWLIARGREGSTKMLTIERDGGVAVPVFSFHEEAEMFLSLEALGEGWGLRRADAGELASTLAGPCSGVEFVALDPLPQMLRRETVGLVSLSRERFVHRLIQKV